MPYNSFVGNPMTVEAYAIRGGVRLSLMRSASSDAYELVRALILQMFDYMLLGRYRLNNLFICRQIKLHKFVGKFFRTSMYHYLLLSRSSIWLVYE